MTRHLTPLGRILALILLAVAVAVVWTVVPHPPLPPVRFAPGYVPGILIGVAGTVAAIILLAVLAWVVFRPAVMRALDSHRF